MTEMMSAVNDAQVWDPVTGSSVGQPLTGHTGRVWTVALSPSGSILASGSADEPTGCGTQ